MMLLWLTFAGFFFSGFFFGRASVFFQLRPRILADHDPNTPFTSNELRRIGIIPPEHYDEWLDEFAKR